MISMPYFETNDHTSLYYRDWGTGAPVVFVNSAVLSGAMWEYQMLPLCEHGLHWRPPHNILYVDGHSGVANPLAIPTAISSTDKGTCCIACRVEKKS